MAVHSLQPAPWSFLKKHTLYWMQEESCGVTITNKQEPTLMPYYDIKMHFQGTKTTKNGKVQMNSTSEDATYNTLLANLRQAMKGLAAHIEPKIYEYGFLKK